MYWSLQDFTAAFVGGCLVGLAIALNYLMFGRLTNISSVFNSLVKFNKQQGFSWKLCFFCGLISLPNLFYWKYGREAEFNDRTFKFFDSDSYAIKHLSLVGWILGGVLVGFGSRMGGGGLGAHGFCGIPRGNMMSLYATMTIMTSAFGLATWRYNHPFFQKGNLITSSLENKLQIFS